MANGHKKRRNIIKMTPLLPLFRFILALSHRIPDFPCGDGLAVQHLQSVLGGGATLSGQTAELGLLWIVYQIVNQMFLGKVLRRELRHFVHLREGAEWGAVDDEFVSRHHLWGEVFVG